MRTPLVAVIIVVLFLVGFGGIYIYNNVLPNLTPNPTNTQTPEPILYQDRDFGFSMYSPSGWTKDLIVAKKLGLKVMFVGPRIAEFVNNVNVAIGFLGDEGIEGFVVTGPVDSKLKDYKLVSFTNTTIGTLKAKEWVYTANINNYKAKNKQVYISKGGNFTTGETLFIITLTSLEENYDKFNSLAQPSIESFKLGR